MRIRTQLILAAFVLAVVPLAAIVTYSYHSSHRALEAAYRGEADRLTQQMDRRLATIRTELDRRLQFVSALPLPSDQTGGDVGNYVTVMGDAASLVDALDFEPTHIKVHEGPIAAVDTQVDVEDHEEPARADVAVDETETPRTAGVAPVPPRPPNAPVVIDLPPVPEMPRFVMSEQQQELIGEISSLGVQLSKPDLSADERQDIREELKAAQEELRRVVEANRDQFHAQMREARLAQREHRRIEQRIEQEVRTAEGQAPRSAPVVAGVMVAPAAKTSAATKPATAQKTATNGSKKPKVVVRGATAKDIKSAADTAKKTTLLLGRSFEAPVRQQGELVGQLTARVRTDQVLHRILGSAADDRSEIPFAIDREGTLYTRNQDERGKLEQKNIPDRVKRERSGVADDGWIVSTSTDPESGLKFGVARPVGDNFDELRRTAARNFGLGLGLIAFALVGIVPLTNHLTRDVKIVTEGAERIAHGDLMTRLPVKTKNELGQLARAFNRMAEDLSVNQQKLLEQERARKAQELQQALLSVEYERKSVELEDARRFQLSMLPKEVPLHPSYDVAVFTRTATEVGGDYYDFHLAGDALSVTIGDATGHGAKAGTMVTVIKTLFSGYGGTSSSPAPAEFLAEAAETIKRMDLGRMAMALSLARFDEGTFTIASAGMPPVFVHRKAAHTVEEIALEATPLGTFGSDYPQTSVSLQSGDTVLFLSDGFPELMNDDAQQLGYTGALDAFAAAAKAPSAKDVIAALEHVARQWHGEAAPNDDVTFVVVRIA
jgi:serine phosphatase RsbU (regulator of sigma subunit)